MKHNPTLTSRQQLELGVMTGLVIAPHLIVFGGLFSGFLLLILLAVLWRAWNKKPLIHRRWVWLLAIASAWVVFKEFSTLLGRDGGLAILISLLTLKLYESRTRRDARTVLLLAFFCAGTQFLQDQSPAMAIAALAGICLITLCSMRIEHPAGHARPQMRTLLRIMLEALPIALLLFVLFPRLPGPLWRVPSETQATSGLSDKALDPGSISRLALDESVAFRAEFVTAAPDRQAMYWRGPVFTQFDGRRWIGAEPDLSNRGTTLHQLTQPVEYTITLEPHQQRWLLALDRPLGAPAGGRMTSAGQILADQNVESRRIYTLSSSIHWRTSELDYPYEQLLIPATGNPRTRALAQSLREQPPGLRVQSALQWLQKGGYRYTLQPPLLTSADSVDEFLFESKRGFCEHFAGSFAYLMRAAGIPSRVVIGYQGGQKNVTGNYFIIRQADAHAWVEIWLAEAGWQRIDPTAIIAPARIDSGLAESLPDGTQLPLMLQSEGSWLKDLRMRSDALMYLWNRWIVEYDAARQLDLLRKMAIPDFMSWQFITLLTSGISMLLLLGFISAINGKWTRRRMAPEVRLYHDFCRIMAKRGLPRHPAEGPHDYCQRIAALWPEAAPYISRFALGYIGIRYGQSDKSLELEELQHMLRQVRKAVKR